jgi:hypothetical protein
MPITVQTGGGKESESDLDKILKGLSILKTGLDAGVDLRKLAGSDPERALQEERLKAAQRENRGVLTAAQLVEKGLAPVTSPLAAGPVGGAISPGAPLGSPLVAAAPGASPLASGPAPLPAPPPLQRFSKRSTQKILVAGPDGKETEVDVGRLDELKDLEKSETDLRKEHDALDTTKNTKLIRAFGDKALAAANAKSGLGDVSAITAFARLIDPQTGVKDQEFNNIARSSGVYDTLANIANNFKSGQRLPESVRKDFNRQVGLLVQAQMKSQANEDERYQGIAKDRGFDKLADEIGHLWDRKQSPGGGAPKEKSTTSSSGSQSSSSATPKPAPKAPASNVPDAQRQAALGWLKANPSHPDAAAVRQRLGL